MKIRSSVISLLILVLFSVNLTSCGTPPASPTSTPLATQKATLEIPTQTPSPIPTPTEPTLPPEMEELFDKLGAKQGTDENGNPIYFVTNILGEDVIVGKPNEKKQWELGDAAKYKLARSKEEALSNVFDYEFVMRGGPGQIAKLNAEAFSEDVIKGLDVKVVIPDYSNFDIPPYNYLSFTSDGKRIIKQNPGKEPYRNMGWFSFVNDEGQQGFGTVWQWINPDGSIINITTVGIKSGLGLNITPFATFNATVDFPFATSNQIANNERIDDLIQQWADTNIIPKELESYAIMGYAIIFS